MVRQRIAGFGTRVKRRVRDEAEWGELSGCCFLLVLARGLLKST
jgi:hypothetical protein